MLVGQGRLKVFDTYNIYQIIMNETRFAERQRRPGGG